MNRSEAISHVIGYLEQIDGEWGPCNDPSVEEEAIEVLTALGVTRDELIAHNLIREGYWYKRYMKVAEWLADKAPLGDIAKDVASGLNYDRAEEREIRERLFSRIRDRDFE
jgi:hypothetical protein